MEFGLKRIKNKNSSMKQMNIFKDNSYILNMNRNGHKRENRIIKLKRSIYWNLIND